MVVEVTEGLTDGGVLEIWQQPETPLCGYQSVVDIENSALFFDFGRKEQDLNKQRLKRSH